MLVTGIEVVLEWADERAGFAALIISMFALYLIRNITSRLDKCQSTDMCQVMHRSLISTIGEVKGDVKDLDTKIETRTTEILHAIQGGK